MRRGNFARAFAKCNDYLDGLNATLRPYCYHSRAGRLHDNSARSVYAVLVKLQYYLFR